jgi:thiol-disulfide isomerase/thioredoxin
VVIVQIFGTWCPNCLDESRYYSDYYKKNKNKGVEFVALAFEYVKTKEKAFEHIHKFKKDIGIDYPILLAQIGTTNKKKAQEKLPMLNHVLSYPTSIFIDKKGDVRKIHTGFNGPATGQKYIDFTIEFESFVDELLEE